MRRGLFGVLVVDPVAAPAGTDLVVPVPHGHRVLVESRNGEPVRGSPLWLDTFDVQPGEVWTVLLRAENPGIWMSHCHNLNHATQGMSCT